jgi:hypothetical protein
VPEIRLRACGSQIAARRAVARHLQPPFDQFISAAGFRGSRIADGAADGRRQRADRAAAVSRRLIA